MGLCRTSPLFLLFTFSAAYPAFPSPVSRKTSHLSRTYKFGAEKGVQRHDRRAEQQNTVAAKKSSARANERHQVGTFQVGVPVNHQGRLDVCVPTNPTCRSPCCTSTTLGTWRPSCSAKGFVNGHDLKRRKLPASRTASWRS